MAEEMPSKSFPIKAGEESEYGNDVCKIHGEVTICGKPEEVEKVWTLLEKQNEHPDICLGDSVISQSNATNVDKESKDGIDDTDIPIESLENENLVDLNLQIMRRRIAHAVGSQELTRGSI